MAVLSSVSVDAASNTSSCSDASAETNWFRFGDGYLTLRATDPDFLARFVDLFGECACSAPPENALTVRCVVAHGHDRVIIEFDDAEPFDAVPFVLAGLTGYGYEEIRSPDSAVRVLRNRQSSASLTFRGSTILADPDSTWPSVTASLAVHRVLRLQPGLYFFHAGSIGITGRGVLIMGPKGAGKTTLSLALADRNHALFGDEIAALRRNTLELVPFRRRLSIRPGPACDGVQQALAARSYRVGHLEDGTLRTYAKTSELFPGPLPKPVPLHAIFFLREIGAAPAAIRFTPTAADVRLLTPFESMTWGRAGATVAFGMLQLLSRVRCYHLEPGPIAETVRMIETLLEDG